MIFLIGKCRLLSGMLKIAGLGVQKIRISSSMKSRRKKMINKMKSKAMHYWSDHKIECLVVAILIVAYIVK
jgi:hypothetical protein